MTVCTWAGEAAAPHSHNVLLSKARSGWPPVAEIGYHNWLGKRPEPAGRHQRKIGG